MAQNGFYIRVDHRSLKAQKEEAELNGDSFLARLFSRVPENTLAAFPLSTQADELKTKDAAQSSSSNAKKFIDSPMSTNGSALLFPNTMPNNKLSSNTHQFRRKLRQKYFETLAQKKHLEDFLQTLHKPNDSQKVALKAYNELVDGIKSKIFSLFTASEKISGRNSTTSCFPRMQKQ